MTLKKKLFNFTKGVEAMMINYFAMQIERGWITLDAVPKKYRQKVKELIEMSNIGMTEDKVE